MDFIIESHNQQLTFSENATMLMIPIEILDDDLFEASFETFTITLSTEVAGLHLSPYAVNVTIEDNDSEL